MDFSGGSGIGKAARELMSEMQKMQQQEQNSPDKAGQSSDSKSFQDTMNAQMSQAAQQVQAPTGPAEILSQAKVDAATPSQRVNPAAEANRSYWGNMIEELVGGQDKMQGIMNMALSGQQFSPPELIAMQAGVYKYAQELELTSKVVEKATSGIKQTMNTQV
jgi:hypothetical protein